MLLNMNAAIKAQLPDTTKNKKPDKRLSMEIFGFMLPNAIYDFKQMDPKWFDAPRPTKLPAYKDQFAPDGQVYFGVRESRFAVKGYTPTPLGTLTTWFEFDMFGSGSDAGQTTIHLRHAYGEVGKFGFGQTWSIFMDPDVFPNDYDFWGPNGMANLRNVEFRYMPIRGDTKLSFALGKPNATADDGVYSSMIELKNVRSHYTLPDFMAEYRYGKPWGYVELAGLVRSLQWKDLDTTGKDYSGKKVGWGFNLSSRIKFFKRDQLHLQLLYGEGIENYVRDAPADIGIKTLGPNAIEGVALPVTGFVSFYDHYWNQKFASTIGYSFVKIDNSNGQAPSAFRKGEYALTNLIYSPAKNIDLEVELQYLTRKNFSDGWSTNDPRIEFKFRYSFSEKFYHENNTKP
jgi:hypothetical protein